MKFYFDGDIQELDAGIKILSKRLGFECGIEGIRIKAEKRVGEIVVQSEGEEVIIKYDKKIHFFRALGLLVEKSNPESSFEVVEAPMFQTNGVMVDVSRNAVMTVNSIKKLLEMMALMGLNFMMLYTEDTYEIKSQPYFGYMRGQYTFEELKECDDYADIFGIEMVPCIQTLAHLASTLKWGYAKEIRDTNDILLVGCDETYTFIDEMIKNASAPFRSKRIHIGMDEAHALGLGKYLDMYGYKRRFDILNEHLEIVKKITDKYQLKPMIWSDMYFRLASKSGDYYDMEMNIPQEVIDDVAEDVQLVYWDYYHHDDNVYRKLIADHQLFNRDILFAGGIWTWGSVVINYDQTFSTTNSALRTCKEKGIKEVFATMWGDGADINVFSALLGIQLYAEHGYAGEVTVEKLKDRFRFCTGGDYDAFMYLTQMDRIYDERAVKHTSSPNPSKFLLWQDLLMGLFDKHIEDINVSSYYSKVEKELMQFAEQAGELRFVFDVPLNIASVLALKSDMGLRIKKNYDAQNMKALTDLVQNQLPDLRNRIIQLHEVHRRQWLKVYKPFGWEILDIRYGGLLSRIGTVCYRLNQYLTGEVNRLEELEEEKLFFDGLYFDKPEESTDKSIGNCFIYQRIISVGSL